MNYGERLKKIREVKGFKQIDVAKKLGIKNNTLSGYEASNRQPDFDTLKKLADLYEVSIDFIITGNEDNNSPDEMWREFLDPKTQIFFKDLENAPEEKIDELIRFWEFIQERDKKK
ncbi:helix-turn-helix domain-containing protein [Virgibacillus salexigens]|uniref:HTH-type transcriptional regulator Xre n=1 Tax=Virgibacillus kapii TaxID=1638645 RepID=A0ABQ2DQN4_9BACI|nr:helix-turn-helix transcriptional regulator [Virgibacillus kapii]GGJ67761.1 HTH-type transcriptional regulator Xre [Virgibacillus kapii]